MKRALLTFFRQQSKFFIVAKEAWIVEYPIVSLLFMPYDELRKIDDCVKSIRNRRNKSVNNISMMSLLEERNYVVTSA